MTTTVFRVPRHRHSPRVRRLAAEAGIDPDSVVGTGPHGRVWPADIAAAAGESLRTVTYVAEVGARAAERAIVVGEIAYGLLDAVRRFVPVVDLELVSESDRRCLIQDGRGDRGRGVITVFDRQLPGQPLIMSSVRSDRLLIAVIGPTTGSPDETALLVVSAQSPRLPLLDIVNALR